jgi:hypothetical protein
MRVRVALNAGNVHVLDLEPGAVLADVEEAVVRLEDVDRSTHRVRLIASGKLLSDPAALVEHLVGEGAFIHCAVSERPPTPPPRRPRNSSRSRRRSPSQQHYLRHAQQQQRGAPSFRSDVVIHLDGLADDASDEADGRSASGEERRRSGADGVVALPVLHTIDENGEVRIIIPSLALRGFDRLRNTGFSDAEISAIRRQFRIARGSSPAPDGDGEEADGDADVDLEIEEAWLNSSGDDAVEADTDADGRSRSRMESRIVVTNSAEGTNIDFLLGCVCGYLIGILTLALLIDKNISRRWRVGIAAGIATNCAFGFLRSSLYVQSGSFSAT